MYFLMKFFPHILFHDIYSALNKAGLFLKFIQLFKGIIELFLSFSRTIRVFPVCHSTTAAKMPPGSTLSQKFKICFKIYYINM